MMAVTKTNAALNDLAAEAAFGRILLQNVVNLYKRKVETYAFELDRTTGYETFTEARTRYNEICELARLLPGRGSYVRGEEDVKMDIKNAVQCQRDLYERLGIRREWAWKQKL